MACLSICCTLLVRRNGRGMPGWCKSQGHRVGVDDVTDPFCGSLQAYLGIQMPWGGYIITAAEVGNGI